MESIPDTPNLLPLSRSKVIEELKGQSNTTVVYHYCDFQDASSTSPTTLLHNVLSQLLPVNGSWIPDFSDLVSRKDKREPPPAGLAELCELIRRACKYHQCVTLAVDALDECKESREDLFDSLRDLTANNGPSIFATSRKEQDILDAFVDLPTISLNNVRDHVEVDMKAYINEELRKRSRLARLSDDLKTKTTDVLIDKADGM